MVPFTTCYLPTPDPTPWALKVISLDLSCWTKNHRHVTYRGHGQGQGHIKVPNRGRWVHINVKIIASFLLFMFCLWHYILIKTIFLCYAITLTENRISGANAGLECLLMNQPINNQSFSGKRKIILIKILSRAREAGSPLKAAAQARTRDTHCPLAVK